MLCLKPFVIHCIYYAWFPTEGMTGPSQSQVGYMKAQAGIVLVVLDMRVIRF